MKIKVYLDKLQKIHGYIAKYKFYFAAGLIFFVMMGSLLLIMGRIQHNGLVEMTVKGESLMKSGKYAEAYEHFNRLVRRYPDSYKAHYLLGQLYLKFNDVEMAKVEFYRAINSKDVTDYNAYFVMADLYKKENNYELAQGVLLLIKNQHERFIVNKLSDFYYAWAENIVKADLPEAIRKYEVAYNYCLKFSCKNMPQIKDKVEESYLHEAEDFLITGQTEEAVNIFSQSIQFHNNPYAHYQLAKIYSKNNIDKAILEYEKAFNLNPKILSSDDLVNLFVLKANLHKKNNDLLGAEYFYEKGKKYNPKLKTPFKPYKPIILSITHKNLRPNYTKDILTPMVIFTVTNISKGNIDYLKAGIVFSVNGKPLSQENKVIADSKMPLKPLEKSKAQNIFSSVPISSVFSNYSVEVKIFLSQQKPDEWRLYRSFYLKPKKTSAVTLQSQ
jgi:tetratricopeptide (TPR) repeat protein